MKLKKGREGLLEEFNIKEVDIWIVEVESDHEDAEHKSAFRTCTKCQRGWICLKGVFFFGKNDVFSCSFDSFIGEEEHIKKDDRYRYTSARECPVLRLSVVP